MKVVIIAPPSPLRRALEYQFAQRHRAYAVVEPAGAEGLTTELLYKNLVLDASTLSNLQFGTGGDIPAEARQHLLEHCRELQVPLVMLGDGRVFDGAEAPLNHREDEELHPASVAGGQLSAMERQLAGELEHFLVLRTGPLFCEGNGEGNDNMLTRLFRALVEGERLELSNSLKFCPTHVADLARVVSGVVDQVSCRAQCWGHYHYNSSGQTTAYEFAEVVYAFASQRIDLVSVAPELIASERGSTLDPVVPVLRCDKILQHFGIKQLPWRAFLPKAVKTLCDGGTQ